jgi:RNA polymerase sigma factor (sigma-70 family)
MATGQLDAFLRHLRRAACANADGGLSDAQLLERFARARDEAAFELLVWRHGGMVLQVCLRVLHRQHDAEDAFQATFLTLARKASGISSCESLGSWLYKVAYRIALRAKTRMPARSLPDGPMQDPAAREPFAGLLWKEFRSALDEELIRLPEKLRVTFVLCCLEGRTTSAAARTLGWPQGTVGTRLHRARELLRRRLARRGWDLSALVGPATVAAGLSANLVDSTVQAAGLGTAQQAMAAGLISAHVAALTKGTLRTMTITKWVLVSAAAFSLCLVGSGATFLIHQARAVEPARAQSKSLEPAPSAKEKDEGVVFKWKFERDTPFYQEMTTETIQTIKVMDRDVRQTQKQTFNFSWTPTERDRHGNWVLKQQIEGVEIDIDIGGNKIAYDSKKKEDANNPLAAFYKALIGAEFNITLDEWVNIKKVEGRDKFLRKLLAKNPELQTVANSIVGEDAVRAMIEKCLLPEIFPGLLRLGDSWTLKAKLDTGFLGVCQTTCKYTYAGKEGNLDKIKVETKLAALPSAVDGPNLAFTIRDGNVKCDGTGFILFDRGKGSLVHMQLDEKLEGELTVTVAGADSKVQVSQRQKTTVKTPDDPPLPVTKPRAGESTEVERLRQENERLKQENERLRRQLKAVEEALHRESRPRE